jgi:acyl carrier protein
LDKAVVFEKLKELMISEFEIDADSISPEKRLDDDLQLDSIDMVDLILSLSDYIGEKINPALFKDARTVRDLVELVSPLWIGKIPLLFPLGDKTETQQF